MYAHIAKDKNLDTGQFKHSNWLPVAPHNWFPTRSNTYTACFLLHVYGLIQYIFFCVWVFSHSIFIYVIHPWVYIFLIAV